MVKLVVDGLQTKYFASATVPQLLKDKKKGESLLTQFEAGPIAMGGSFKTTATSSQIFRLLAQKIWTIKVAPVAGAPVGGGAATATPGPVGTPEDAPDITFVAQASPNDNGFLGEANAYHATFGLNPQPAKSFESIVRILATANTPIPRLRIVSHFSLDPKAKSAQVFIPLFDGQFHANGDIFEHAERWHFSYGKSDALGLLALFENELLPQLKPGFLSEVPERESTATNRRIALHAVLLQVLQRRTDPSLVPLGLQTRAPAGAVLTLVKWCGDLFGLDKAELKVKGANPTVAAVSMPADIVAAHKTFVRGRIDALKTDSGPTSGSNVAALVNVFTGLTIADLPVPGGRTHVVTMTNELPGTFLMNHDSLRTDLAKVRQRLKDAAVDIRGCRVGQDVPYLQAVREFFGVAGHEPTVSGPEWFQAFTIRGRIAVPAEANIDGQFTSGEPSFKITGADVQRAYSDWSGMIGLAAQLSFWSQLFAGNKNAFLARTWIARLPPLGMNAAHVTGLSALSYANLLARLREIFFIPDAIGPTAAEANAFNTSSMANVIALNAEIDAVDQLPANASQAVLQTRLTALQNVASAIGQTLPAAPNPLTIDFLMTTCVPQLSAPLVTASKIDPLLTALKAKADHANFGIRYMMGVGLPLVVQSAQQEEQTVIMHLLARQTDALKSLAGIHWKRPVPAAVDTAIATLNPVGPRTELNGVPTNDTARASQLSLLTIDTVLSQLTINPEDEFASLIRRVP
jgi:hypothetical protein